MGADHVEVLAQPRLLDGLQHTNDHGRHSARLQGFVHAFAFVKGHLQRIPALVQLCLVLDEIVVDALSFFRTRADAPLPDR